MGKTAQWILEARKAKRARERAQQQERPTTTQARQAVKARVRSSQQTRRRRKHGRPV